MAEDEEEGRAAPAPSEPEAGEAEEASVRLEPMATALPADPTGPTR